MKMFCYDLCYTALTCMLYLQLDLFEDYLSIFI